MIHFFSPLFPSLTHSTRQLFPSKTRKCWCHAATLTPQSRQHQMGFQKHEPFLPLRKQLHKFRLLLKFNDPQLHDPTINLIQIPIREIDVPFKQSHPLLLCPHMKRHTLLRLSTEMTTKSLQREHPTAHVPKLRKKCVRQRIRKLKIKTEKCNESDHF